MNSDPKSSIFSKLYRFIYKHSLMTTIFAYSLILLIFARFDVFEKILAVFIVLEHAEVDEMFLVGVLFAIFFLVVQCFKNKKTSRKNKLNVNKLKQQQDALKSAFISALSSEERHILNHLIEEKGKSTQSEIAKLSGMNNVRAYRVVQRLQAKSIVLISSQGKIRNVELSKNLKEALI